jgi:tetrapyrrole methylase family protein/MazG family protein
LSEQRLTVVGLGPGNPSLITREAWSALEAAGTVYLRTATHPAVAGLPPEVELVSFDEYYERYSDFSDVYRAIIDRLSSLSPGVVYAVPGDPSVGEATVQGLREAGIKLRLIPGISFIEPSLAALGLDALDGLVIVDAIGLAAGHHPPFPPDLGALVCQLHSPFLAGELKLSLMNQYPEEHPVALIHRASLADERVEWVKLYEIDRSESIGDLTTLYVSALPLDSSVETLQNTVARLRAPDGCPWDQEQTHQSLRKHLLEEAYETLAALDEENLVGLKEELGDLLLQIVLQVQIATEQSTFRMADVVAGIQAKLIRRHPHVFGDLQVSGVEQVLRNWEHFKEQETGTGPLAGVPRSFPALAQAAELQGRASRLGFDWPSAAGVRVKIQEELDEIDAADNAEARAQEIGDLLFTVVNYARWLEADPESELRQANQRFRSRFDRMTALSRERGSRLEDLPPEELDRLWEAVKGELG